jgi:uncharacterized protein (TIGR02217 family)
MMAFFEALFPPEYSANAQGGPRFFTTKAGANGRRVANLDDPYPVHDYTFNKPPETKQQFEDVRNFFYVVGGDADGFRFKDWNDYQLTQNNSTLVLITGTTWQITRLYEFGSRTFQRPIYKISGSTFGDPTIKIYRTRSTVRTLLTITTDYSINLNTGVVTLVAHVAGDTYDCEGVFHVPCAFRDPAAVWTFLGTSKMLTEWSGIELEEFRL